MKTLLPLVALFAAMTLSPLRAQPTVSAALPEPLWIGAEVFIEPGQTPAEIETWFRQLQEAGMTYTRIRLFENYMRTPDGGWDFSLFDAAYRAAEKHGIRVYGNLFPATTFEDVGGFKFPRTDEHWEKIREYIRNVVPHFRQFGSCYGWVPINEPGVRTAPDEPFSRQQHQAWLKAQPTSAYRSDGYTTLDFSAERFVVDYQTWYLRRLTDEIRRYDPKGAVHVNSHAIFNNVSGYDFRAWTPFLTSLGGSAHASWHFGYFSRDRYAGALSANAEIIRSGAGKLPWFMTELQGGNNTYSGMNPLCPTPEEITQWIWLTYATGGRGAMFWCLNPRRSGFEAGEWAMLDFLNEPSERLQAAAAVGRAVAQDAQFWAAAHVMESGVSILYTRESLWIEQRLQIPGAAAEGRKVGGVMKSALAYFEALGELGLQANVQAIDDFDFEQPSFDGKTIILAHQISIPSRCWPRLERFVERGGKLIVDGLTAYYDENAYCAMGNRFPLARLFGGTLREVQLIADEFEVRIGPSNLPLSAHLWRGALAPDSGAVLGRADGKVIALRNRFGRGEVLWVPSLLGLGARLKRDYRPLAALLEPELRVSADYPVRFARLQPGFCLKAVGTGRNVAAVVVNQGAEAAEVALAGPVVGWPAHVAFGNEGGHLTKNMLAIGPRETVVIRWTAP